MNIVKVFQDVQVVTSLCATIIGDPILDSFPSRMMTKSESGAKDFGYADTQGDKTYMELYG